MSALSDFLHAEFRIGKKFTLEIIDGYSAPDAHHEDAYYTDRKTGKPTKYAHPYGSNKWNTYNRAENKLLVGRDWLRKWFPLMFARAKLDGTNRLILEPADIDYYRRITEHANLVESGKEINLRAWEDQEARKAVRTLDEEGDLLYA